MADVVGAFKVLIESQPQNALDGFGKIVDASKKAQGATDSWGESIKVLNAGLEITKTIGGALVSAIGAVSDAAIGAGKSFLDLAARGGNFREQAVQFNNFAASFGVNADLITDKIKDIAAGTVSMREAMSLAGKGLAAGLKESDLLTVLELAKKKSEVTGESFTMLGEKIISAAAKGGRALGTEFGIMVGETDRLEDVIAKAGRQLDRFGSTGFNAGDILTSLNNTWIDLVDTVGMWLNEIPMVQRWFNLIAGAAEYFYDSVGELEWAFKSFLEVGLQVVSAFAKVFIGTFEGSFDSVFDVLKLGVKGWKGFFSSIVSALGIAGDYVIAFYNTAVDVVSAITSVFTKIPAAIVGAFSLVGRYVTTFFGGVATTALDALDSILSSVASLVASYPSIAEATGLDSFAREAGRSLAEVRTRIGGVVDEQTTFFDTLAEGFEQTDRDREAFFDNFRIDPNKFSRNIEQVQKQIDGINLKETGQSIYDNLKRGDALEQFFQQNQLDFKRNEAAQKAAATAAKTARAEEKRKREKAQREEDAAIDKMIKKEKALADKQAKEKDKLAAGTKDTALAAKDVSDAFGDSAKNVNDLTKKLIDLREMEKSGEITAFDRMSLETKLERQIDIENYRQERILAAIEQAVNGGIKHILEIEDAGDFVNEFMREVFKVAGVKARMEMVKVAGT